jgi:hypothetical protein
MTLLAPLALLLGFSAAVPLLLHLYQRRRRSVLAFSTTRFFTRSIIRSQRRLRLRRLWLLLLRIATCLLLAAALARPVLGSFGTAQAGKRDLVILLDDSLSMQATKQPTSSTPNTRFDHARALALDILRSLAAGDQAAVVTFTGRTLATRTPTGPALTGNLTGLLDDIRRLQPSSAAGDAHAALATAAAMLENAGPRHPHLIILSDLQETDWRYSEWPAPPQPVSATLVPLAPPTSENVLVDRVTLSQPVAIANQQNLLRIRLVNHRPNPSPARLVVYVGDREILRRPLELPGASPHIEQIPMSFENPGRQRLRIQLEAQDALPQDNTLFHTVKVLPRLSVLLVSDHNGAPATHRSRAATTPLTYLQAALRALATPADSLQLDIRHPDALPGTTLEAYHVVILCDLPALAPTQRDRLEAFVRNGGGLAAFAGAHAPSGNAATFGDLLPARLGGVVDVSGEGKPLRILQADLEHPMMQRFAGPLRSALSGIAVYRVRAAQPEQAWTVASLTGDHPLILERALGRGHVMLWTTLPDPRCTNLPLRRSFLPLVGRMVSYLAGPDGHAAEHVVGESLPLPFDDRDPEQPVDVLRPDRTTIHATLGTRDAAPIALLPPDAVTQPGFYLVRPDGRPPGEPSTRCYAVNVPRQESLPVALDLDQVRSITGNWQLRVVKSAQQATADDLTTAINRSRGGHGVWDTLLLAALLLMLVEPLIANRPLPATAAAKQPIRRAGA